MSRGVFFLLIGMLCQPAALHAASADADYDAATILSLADGFRKPDGDTRVELDVLLFQNGEMESRKAYTVYMKPGRRSLALFKSPGEQGQKALQLDDRFYLLLPKSRRPVRISPMQKLLGEAAIGDISTMVWSEDYNGQVADAAAMVGDTPAIRLTLTARRAGVTYDKIELWVARHDFRPIQACLFLKSGRIAKKVVYRAGSLNGREMITAMVMDDRIRKQKRTEIRYRSIEPAAVPDRYFNPAYLARNHVD